MTLFKLELFGNKTLMINTITVDESTNYVGISSNDCQVHKVLDYFDSDSGIRLLKNSGFPVLVPVLKHLFINSKDKYLDLIVLFFKAIKESKLDVKEIVLFYEINKENDKPVNLGLYIGGDEAFEDDSIACIWPHLVTVYTRIEQSLANNIHNNISKYKCFYLEADKKNQVKVKEGNIKTTVESDGYTKVYMSATTESLEKKKIPDELDKTMDTFTMLLMIINECVKHIAKKKLPVKQILYLVSTTVIEDIDSYAACVLVELT